MNDWEPERLVGFLINRCGTLLARTANRRFTPEGISLTQWQLLMRLIQCPLATVTEINEHIGHDPGALTRLLDDLETQGLLTRHRCEDDRRVVKLAITPEGECRAQSGKQIMIELLSEVLEPYSKSEVRTFIALLEKLLSSAQEVSQSNARGSGASADPATSMEHKQPARDKKPKHRTA
jgi:DNA-binding MarR family transcriptional regulator